MSFNFLLLAHFKFESEDGFMFFETPMAQRAIELMTPTIQGLLTSSMKIGLHVVIMVGNHNENGEDTTYPVVYDKNIGGFVKKYADCAMGKARLSWRTRALSSAISGRYSGLIQDDDCVYGGGVAHAVDTFCISVGVSGLAQHEDKAIAVCIIEFIDMLMQAKVRNIAEENNGMV